MAEAKPRKSLAELKNKPPTKSVQRILPKLDGNKLLVAAFGSSV